MPNVLFDLPQELWIQILSNLDAISLTNCAMTCRSMNEALRNSSQLQYILQLNFEGLEDAGTYMAHSELVLRLQRRRRAWLSLTAIHDHRGVAALDIIHNCNAYELVGGAFANTDGYHFEIAWLPTSGNAKGSAIERMFAGLWVRDFAMDPTQDLIAFLDDDRTASFTVPRTIRIHVRTISTNVSHPRARVNPLQITVLADRDHGNTIHNAILQFARNTLVLYFCTSAEPQPRIQIWDWTTSDVLVDSSVPFDPLLLTQRLDFGILDATYCFVTSVSESGSIRLYKFMRSPSVAGLAIHLATLHLPPTSSHHISRISTHTGPIEANPLAHTPFIISDRDRLHSFTIIYQNSHDRTILAVDMFVHQRVFTKYCMRADHEHGPLDIPWAEWGPQNTRLIYPSRVQRHWLRYIHGQRVVCPARSTDDIHGDGPPGRFEVFDFSLAAILSQKGVDSISPFPWTLVPPTVISTSEVLLYQDDVETRLPYISSTRNVDRMYSAYMVYEGGVVGVTTKEDGGLLLHVYPV